MQSTWSPEQYNRFYTERRQPFFDLLALVHPRSQMRVIDLGCGTGELTRVLHQRLAARETLGVDSSETMLAHMQSATENGLRFMRDDLREHLSDSHYDLVFSNAALHWIPDHDQLFDRLTAALAPGGQLAVQMPANQDHLSQLVAAEVATEEPFRQALAGYVRPPLIMAPEAYALLLRRLGYRDQHVRVQVYGHSFTGRDEIVEWQKGTLLTHYQERLPPPLFAPFLDRYRSRLLPQLDDRKPYFFLMKRLLLWAQR